MTASIWAPSGFSPEVVPLNFFEFVGAASQTIFSISPFTALYDSQVKVYVRGEIIATSAWSLSGTNIILSVGVNLNDFVRIDVFEASPAANLELPVQTFQAGRYLRTNGTVPAWEVVQASQVAFTPAGNLSGTDVQAALVELDLEKVSAADLANNTNAAKGSALVGYLPAVAGAVGGTVQTKLMQIVNVEDFGAVGDGVADDTAAFQRAVDHVSTRGGGTVTFNGRHLLDSTLTTKEGVWLKGPLGMPGEILPGTLADYDGKLGVLVVNSAGTLNMQNMTMLSNCIVIRKGLNLPFLSGAEATTGVAAFAGTAVTVVGADCSFENILVLGFNYAVRSVGQERIRCKQVVGDCLNGIWIDGAYDICYLDRCHFWPWTTVHQTWTTAVLLRRPGTAFKMASGGDWNKITNCFSYGYYRGFYIADCNSVTLSGCGADNALPHAGAIGFLVEGNCTDIRLLECQAAAQDVAGYYFIHSAGLHATLVSCDAWTCAASCITVASGSVSIIGGTLRNTLVGVYVTNTNSVVNISGVKFDALGTAPIDCAVPSTNIHIGKNDYGDWGAGLSVANNTTIVIKSLASADPLQLPHDTNFFQITGTTSFGTLNGGWAGRDITLKFAGVLTVNDGGASLKLSGSFVTGVNATLRLIHDGVAWCEVSRSSN